MPRPRLASRRSGPLAAGAALATCALLVSFPSLVRADNGVANAREIDSLTNSLNLAWVLIAGFLVMFMQLGFAMLETGFTRAKNAVNTMAMNFIIYPVGVLGFWLTGYGFMMGGVGH